MCRQDSVPLTLSKARRLRIKRIFPTRNSQNKRDILSEKLERGMSLKKREFTPESGNVDSHDSMYRSKQSGHKEPS